MQTLRLVAPLAGLALTLALGSCASVEFIRDTETSGRFKSTGMGVTILSLNVPKSAKNIAIENASDARQPNMVITKQTVFPYLGPVDWLLEIFSIRYARIEGTWGFEPEP